MNGKGKVLLLRHSYSTFRIRNINSNCMANGLKIYYLQLKTYTKKIPAEAGIRFHMGLYLTGSS